MSPNVLPRRGPVVIAGSRAILAPIFHATAVRVNPLHPDRKTR
jgi:hypothetical protein